MCGSTLGAGGPETYPDKQSGSFEPRNLDPARDRHLAVESNPIRSVILIVPSQRTEQSTPAETRAPSDEVGANG